MGFWILFWISLGLALVMAELLLPGGIALFMGLGALFIAGLHSLDLIQSPLTGFTIWFIVSTFMMFTLKGIVDRFLPHSESKGEIDEDVNAFGTIVSVVEEIDHQKKGRISYMGSTWPAQAKNTGDIFKPGDKVVLILKNNLTWMVDTPPHPKK